MEAFNSLIQLIVSGLTAYGVFEIVFGLVTLATGFKNHTGPEILRGAGGLVGGALVVTAAITLSTISIG